jgi:DNA-binding transcriptional regulator PaaX
MAEKLPISTIILKILSTKSAFKEEDLLACIDVHLKALNQTPGVINKPYYGISRSVKNLANMGHIEHFMAGQGLFFKISNTGKQKLISLMLESKDGLVNPVWDGFWRMIVVDLPESRKSDREAIRYLLRKAKFYSLKNSVWVTPYPFEHLCNDIKTYFNLHKEMSIFISKSLDEETEKELREIFNLI